MPVAMAFPMAVIMRVIRYFFALVVIFPMARVDTVAQLAHGHPRTVFQSVGRIELHKLARCLIAPHAQSGSRCLFAHLRIGPVTGMDAGHRGQRRIAVLYKSVGLVTVFSDYVDIYKTVVTHVTGQYLATGQGVDGLAIGAVHHGHRVEHRAPIFVESISANDDAKGIHG